MWRQGRIQQPTYCKQDKVLLVVLADTVVDPRTVVVHLANAPFTDTEMTIFRLSAGIITLHGLKQALHSNKPAGAGEYQTPAPTLVCDGRLLEGKMRTSRVKSFFTRGS